MDEKDKLSGIKDYLKEFFPKCVIENMWDSKSREDIVICLKLYNLKGYLEIFGNKEIVVTDDGINPEGISPSLLE
jgi:hypothetical protein